MTQDASQKLISPNNEKRILLHCCCAPCSGAIIEKMLDSNLQPTILFYNPNIHPQEEYERRKETVASFAEKKGIAFFDLDYDPENWFERVKGFEQEPERGKRCFLCFDMRLERTALFAHENGFKVFATTLGLSRWKDIKQVNTCGLRAASNFPDLTFWGHNWRLKGGSQKMYEIAKKEHLYKQKYCGCQYSLESRNKERLQKGQAPISDNPEYY